MNYDRLGDYRLKTLPVPEPGPKEILVKVKAVGVCASDGKCYSGAEVYWGKPGTYHYFFSCNTSKS